MAKRMGVIKQMKMLIIGDSYATNYSELAWPVIVENHFNCKADNHAKPASSLNFSYNILTNSLKNNTYDVVIFALTSADRLYHPKILIHGGFPQYHDGAPITKEIKKAIESYYMYLYDTTNNDLTRNIFGRSIAQLSLEYPFTKFIFVPAFDPIEHVSVGNCVITNQRLIHYSMLDKKSHAAEVRGEIIERHNHLSFLQNKMLANYIIEFINDYKFGCVAYKILDRLEVLK